MPLLIYVFWTIACENVQSWLSLFCDLFIGLRHLATITYIVLFFYWAVMTITYMVLLLIFLLHIHDPYRYGPFFFFELRHLAYMVLFFILSELSHIGICNNGLLPPLPPMSAYDSIFFTLPCNMFRIAPNKICDTASVGSFIPYLPFCVCRQTFLLGDYKIPVHRCRFHFYSVSRLVVYTFLP